MIRLREEGYRPPLFAAVFLVEGWRRPGYDPFAQTVSELAIGPAGFIQIGNLLLFGALFTLVYAGGMSDHDWNEHYASGHLPWDTGAPDEQLVSAVEKGIIAPGRALEIGCGTGTNALWLAQRGFDVIAIDVAPLAIEAACKKKPAGARCDFAVLDFLVHDPPRAPFDFVFDRGCFHVFDADETRARFAARVAALLQSGGQWLSLIGSTEGPPAEGPPRRSARDVMNAIEPVLEIVELHTFFFEAHIETPAKAWSVRARRRDVPPQPSTGDSQGALTQFFG